MAARKIATMRARPAFKQWTDRGASSDAAAVIPQGGPTLQRQLLAHRTPFTPSLVAPEVSGRTQSAGSTFHAGNYIIIGENLCDWSESIVPRLLDECQFDKRYDSLKAGISFN